jgi:hypothetical protein
VKPYRTFLTALAGMGLLSLCALRGVHGEDLQAVKWGIVGIVGMVAGRAVGIAAAGGGGVKGMVGAVLTNAKPEAQ